MHRSLYATPDSALSTVILLPSWRRGLARLLRLAARALCLVSRRLARPASSGTAAASTAAGELPRIEFCAEAGAPEGALYIDGEYVGRLDIGRL